MPGGTGATRDEVYRAIQALTLGERLKLKKFAAWRVRGLGRASCGRTWEDLLSEAYLSKLEGTADNGSGRRWRKNVDLVTLFCGAMRSISSHWKRDFVEEEEALLESQIAMRGGEDAWISPLDEAVSDDPSQERDVTARQEWALITKLYLDDVAARGVLEGWSRGMTASEIMEDSGLTKWEYQETMRRIRLRLREQDETLRSKGRRGRRLNLDGCKKWR
jgi:hypothetical protein